MSVCHNCMAPVDDAEHALFLCDRWWRLRRKLEVITGAEFSPETVVKLMLENQEKWDAVCGFVINVMKTREEEERQRQRDPANNE